MKNRILIIAGIVIVATGFGVYQYLMYDCGTLPIFSETPYNPTIGKCLEIWQNKSQQSEQKTTDITEISKKQSVNFDNFSSMEQDSVKFFYYPNPEDTENRDAFETYMLIRLPEWLGGATNDASAYRVYSAKAVDDPCLIKYWGGEDRQRIENPCRGGFYRVHDGVMTFTFGSVPNTHPVALPHLDLSIDKNGFLYIDPPAFTKTENGVISYGRHVSLTEITEGSQFYIDSFANYHPGYPKFPLYFGGLQLADIADFSNGGRALYSDFGPISNSIEMKITECNCIKFNPHYSFQITENINGVDVVYYDTKSKYPESDETHNKYFFNFVKNGFQYLIVGKEYNEIRHSIKTIILEDLEIPYEK